MKYPVNQRVRDLMKALGYKGHKKDAYNFGQRLLGEGERTDKVKNFYKDKNGISTELLVLITRKIVNGNGQKPNGHWLLTGKGPMFLDENITQDYKITEIENKLNDIGGKVDELMEHKEKGDLELKKNSPITKPQP